MSSLERKIAEARKRRLTDREDQEPVANCSYDRQMRRQQGEGIGWKHSSQARKERRGKRIRLKHGK